MKISFIAVGGTIDKVYFDKLSEYQIGNARVEELLKDARVGFEYQVNSILRKDSLDMTDADRELVRQAVENDENRYIVITHGTDTMVETANRLKEIKEKVIVLTGAMEPAAFKSSDAFFNLGSAVAAVQILNEGVYIAINGRIFDPARVKKDRSVMQFTEKREGKC
ncbi:MAG: asparaginase domain-containing protein [Desulfarculaceae bacterium]|nr:asparaginase domain-containing protein [Desulfarculaceae bacterium]